MILVIIICRTNNTSPLNLTDNKHHPQLFNII